MAWQTVARKEKTQGPAELQLKAAKPNEPQRREERRERKTRKNYVRGMVNVAQICNLLYRRFLICCAFDDSAATGVRTLCRMQFGDTADCKSALRTDRTSCLCAFALNPSFHKAICPFLCRALDP